METESHKQIVWQKNLEEYFCHTGEKAHCLAWLHKRSEEMYSARTVWIDLPVIILGTLNGAVSVGSQSLFGNSEFASVGVGAVALVTAILSTVGSYFSWSRRAEGHRISSLNYAKLYRFLQVELSLPRAERMSPADLLKYVKTEYDRLCEVSPLLPPTIVDNFKSRFNKPEYAEISKPEDANGLHAIHPYSETVPPTASSLQVNADAPKEKTPTKSKDVPDLSSPSPLATDNPPVDSLAGHIRLRISEPAGVRDSAGVPRGAADARNTD